MESKVVSLVWQNITMKAQPFSREGIISIKDPIQLWNDNWFAVVLEVVSAFVLFQLYRNAKKKGPQSAYLILAAISAAITFEVLPIIPCPGYQLWWYHQGIVNILKQRVPSYVVSIYALVLYMAHGLTTKSNLPIWTRSLVTAIAATLIMFPCLWFAPKLLLLVLHFDDDVFKDQIAGVPYIQIVIMLLLFFHTSHLFHENFMDIEQQERNVYSYTRCAIQSGIVSAIYAIIEQYLLFIFLKLTVHMNTAFCLVAAVSILLFLARQEIREKKLTSYSMQGIISPLLRKEFWIVAAAMVFISSLPLWLNTQNLKSTGDRLELGPCHMTHAVSNTSPLDTIRRRYICPNDTDVLNFDFHCAAMKDVTQGINNKTKHYTICGKQWERPAQLSKLFLIYSAYCLAFFYCVMLYSFTFKVQEKKISDNIKKAE